MKIIQKIRFLIEPTTYHCIAQCGKTKKTFWKRFYDIWACSKECHDAFLDGSYRKNEVFKGYE